jgi:hypothetical protein
LRTEQIRDVSEGPISFYAIAMRSPDTAPHR